MKRRDLVKRLEIGGCELLRHGGRHDIYHNPVTGHREINEILAKKILRSLTEGN